jgi:hypothetical protein
MAQLSRWQNIWNNYFAPKAWLITISNWLSLNGLSYNTSKTLAMYVFAYNAVAVGATTINFIPAAAQTNPVDEHMMITEVDMYDGASATLAATNWALGVSDALGKQGLLSITAQGTLVLKELPLTQFIPAANDADSGKFQLLKPIMWKGQTPLTAFANYLVAPATANYNLRLELVGLKLI